MPHRHQKQTVKRLANRPSSWATLHRVARLGGKHKSIEGFDPGSE
jgi:hypothetical protein